MDAISHGHVHIDVIFFVSVRISKYCQNQVNSCITYAMYNITNHLSGEGEWTGGGKEDGKGGREGGRGGSVVRGRR